MMKEETNKIELLAPAGSYEIFLAVLAAGADAVYVGGNLFGARAYANNFSEEELLQAIDYAHLHNKKLYLTVNTLLKEKEIKDQLYSYLLPYYKQGLDAVIVQDVGAMQLIHECFKDLDIHTSTQMTITNRYGAKLMKELGATRVVTARELSLKEIEDISKHVDIEIESFVHGALCYCYSGQCLMSSIIGGRSGNRGRCAQPCRLPYEVYDDNKKLLNNSQTPYVLSPKDLSTLSMIPSLVESGIDSFKIEGRMKQAAYAAGVVTLYRKYIDLYLEKGKDAFHVDPKDAKKLLDLGNRCGFTEGFYKKHNGADIITLKEPSHKKNHEDIVEKQELKEKIKGKLMLSFDLPVTMTVTYKHFKVTVTGDIVQKAQKQPLTFEKVKENVLKTGNTPFEFEELDISMDDAIFLPMKAINQVRRDALDALEAKILSCYHRECTNSVMNHSFMLTKNHAQTITYTASIEQRSQLKAVLQFDKISDIYLDSSCYHKMTLVKELKEDLKLIQSKGKKAYFILPAVFRRETSLFYQSFVKEFQELSLHGFVIKNFDALSFIKQYFTDAKIIFDHNLYSYNSKAIEALNKFSPEKITAPFELNKNELKHRNNANSEIIIYGRIPLMTSASCTMKTTGACKKQSGVSYLKDRYGKQFFVKRDCEECYNVLYNTVPLSLFPVLEEIEKMGFTSYRFAFTIEDEKKVQEVLFAFENHSPIPNEECTYGHYKRGVE